jgi:hypothetical protein
MKLAYLFERSEGDCQAGDDQDQTDKQPGEDLEAAVTIRMIRIRRPRGDQHSEKHDHGCQNIAGKLQARGDD